MEFQTQIFSPEFNNDTIIAYPQGIIKQWIGDPEASFTSEINDVEFANDLDYIEGEYGIDTSHVYATGFSNAGGLTDLLACDPKVSVMFAAVVIASGASHKDSALEELLVSRCTPGHVPPIMEFHGSKDPVEHCNGKPTPDGEPYTSMEWAEEWAVRKSCNKWEENKIVKLFNGHVEKIMRSC